MFPPPDLAALSPAARAAVALQSPGSFYMTGEDVLQISGWNITTGVRLTVSGRFLTLEGRIQSFVHDVALTTDRVIASLVRSLGDGWLLNLTVTSGATSSPYGATFARVQVVRGLAGSGIVLGTLCAGYVTSAQPIAFPGGRVRSMIEGRGNIRSITGTNPAAGVDWAETVPTGVRWRLLALTATLATDATAANRQARFGFTDGAANLYRSDAPNNQTASTSVVYNAGHGTARIAMVSDQPGWGLPTEMFLLAGYTIFSATGSIQAGDNWGAPQLLVEEFLDAN